MYTGQTGPRSPSGQPTSSLENSSHNWALGLNSPMDIKVYHERVQIDGMAMFIILYYKIEKVPWDIQGKMTRKVTVSSRKLVSTIRTRDGNRCPEG